MDDQFLEPRDHIDTDALVARLRDIAATRAISTNGHAHIDQASEEMDVPSFPDALAAQAELNRRVAGAIEHIGAYLGQLEDEISALRRENAELSERVARLSEHTDSARHGEASHDGEDPATDLEALRNSLQVSLAGVEALLDLRRKSA
jgi:hypothetical protein